MIKEKNAVITSVALSNADHGYLSAWIHLDYGNSGQGFGGYNLYSPNLTSNKNYAGIFIWRCMEVVGVSEWNNMVGKAIRVKWDYDKVHSIGHIIEDIWFNPSEEFKEE